MKILWLKSELLHPVDKGGKIRTYQMLRSLAHLHHVTYLCLDDGSAAIDARTRAAEYSNSLITVSFSQTQKRGVRFFLDLFANLFSPLPYALWKYESNDFRRKLDDLAGSHDLIICDFLTPSVSMRDELKKSAVLFQHNVEAMIWKRHAMVPQNVVRRAYMTLQWRRMERYESLQCRTFGKVIAVSEADQHQIQKDYGISSVTHVPTGVDLEYFQPTGKKMRAKWEVVFVGSMDWMPNEEGILWFVSEIFSLVLKEVPEASLTVVGRDPPQSILDLRRDNPAITVTGTVPDVRPFLEKAAISIVPLRIGGGTRLKIYEAMAMGSTVVSTTIGAEGLPVTDGQHLLLADSPEEQASAIVGLMRNQEQCARIATAARQYVEDNCSWDAVTNRFVESCLK